MRARLKRGFNHYEDGRLVEPGTEVEMTEERFANLRDRFARVGVAPSKMRKGDAQDGGDDDFLKLLDGTVPDIEDNLKEVDDVEQLKKLVAAEKKNQGGGRKGVLSALDDRIEELEDDEDDEDNKE